MGFEIGSSPENLVGIGETGGVQIPKMTDWSFEFWFLMLLANGETKMAFWDYCMDVRGHLHHRRFLCWRWRASET
jgi:hypothetical protein